MLTTYSIVLKQCRRISIVILRQQKGETSHTEARNDYAADREAVADLVQQMYDATEGDGQKQIMQKIYDGVNNVLERMDNAMEKYDDGKTGKVSIEVNVIRVCMEEVNTYITGIQQKSVNEMDEATAQSHATYQAVSKVCVGMAAVSILVGIGWNSCYSDRRCETNARSNQRSHEDDH